ncbi:MAG: LysM peptidoglycan-binding domain-containing protein [Lachnospiraceae bacterium]|nr:LysM peptidoglycan-binding domain-containing protein [Lachnospiraceae bacterium]
MMSRAVKGKVLMAVVIAVLALFFIFVSPVRGLASEAGTRAGKAETETVYVTYVVEPGDTLWDIAEDNLCSKFSDTQSYIKEVMRANHIENSNIHTGQLIIIPQDAATLNAQVSN